MIYSTPSNINVYFSTLCEGTSASIVFLKEPRCPGGSPRARGASCRTVLKPQKGGRTMLFSFIMLYWLKVCGHILVAGEGGRWKTPQRYTECTLLACRQCRASTHNTKKHPNRFRIRPEWGASGSRATVLYSRFNFRAWKKNQFVAAARPQVWVHPTASTHWSWTPPYHKKGRGSAVMYISDRAYLSTT